MDEMEAARKNIKKSEAQEVTDEKKDTDSSRIAAQAAQNYVKNGSSGNAASSVGGAVMGAALSEGLKSGATMNPYAIGIGGGLMAYGAVKDSKEAQAKAEYEAKIDQLNREQAALSNVSQLAQRFKSF